ncbi:hypothetical protein BDQ17DRAFT_637836 [Cyathus striatus]|nr:hypothetical protein BDQ17DRAFT_637836 [Cyathus striatus]
MGIARDDIGFDSFESLSLALSDFSDHHIHTQSLSTTVPDKHHLHHPISYPFSNDVNYVASTSTESDRLYLVRIIAPNQLGQHPPLDVLMHIRASPHEGVTDVLHHYFGEVYNNSSCNHCTSGGGTQAPQFAIVILPYYSDRSLSHYVDTDFFDTHPTLAVSTFHHLVDLFLFFNAQRYHSAVYLRPTYL